MKKLFSTCLVVILAVTFGLSQQASDVPESVKVSLDALLKTRTPNGVFEMKGLNSYFYASQGAVYTNILFYANLEADAKELKANLEAKHREETAKYEAFVAKEEARIEELNKKIRAKNKNLQAAKRIPEKTWEKPEAPQLVPRKAYHNLYLRVVKDGKVVQKYKSPMPLDEEKTEYYSFGLILEPGKYDLLINVNRFDSTQDGTLLMEVEVPKMTVMDILTPAGKISNSPATLYKKVNTLHVAEERFTVVKNCYVVNPAKLQFYPLYGDEYAFKSDETPTLTFFILGVPQPWDVEVQLQVKQGKKKIVVYKVPAMQNPYFFQPITFKGPKNKPLDTGEYVLEIKLIDNNKKSRKGEIELPFKIIE